MFGKRRFRLRPEALEERVMMAADIASEVVAASADVAEVSTTQTTAINALHCLQASQGDYNGDLVVDASDYTVWRDSLGQSGAMLPADGNGDGSVTQLDYDVWSANYGETIVALDDCFEDNDSSGAASDLGTLVEPLTITGLAMRDAIDWFRFTLTEPGDAASRVLVLFEHSKGDLDTQLFNSNGQLVRLSDSISSDEEMSLEGLPAGDYLLAVFGFNLAQNPSYSIEITP